MRLPGDGLPRGMSQRLIRFSLGAKKDEVEPGKRDRLASLLPSFIRTGMFLTKTLKEIAVNSSKTVDIMTIFHDINPNRFMYARSDADQGVSNIKLDNYLALDDLRTKTNLYLEEQGTKDRLEEVGEAIAIDYCKAHLIQTHKATACPVVQKSDHNPKVRSLNLASSEVRSTSSTNGDSAIDTSEPDMPTQTAGKTDTFEPTVSRQEVGTQT